MYLVFVGIVAVVVFVVIATALGRGDLLEDESLPAGAPLPADVVTPEDVDGLALSVVPRGYRMDQVDDVLARLRDELAARDRRIAHLENATRQPALPRRPVERGDAPA